MKIIVRKADSVIIYGTNNNQTTIEVINNNLVINGQIIATNINENNFELVEDDTIDLINPFFVGYTAWLGYFEYTEEYQNFNSKTSSCLQKIREEYYLKSQDSQYSDEEKQSFVEYYTLLDNILNIEYLEPTFSYPIPPDESFPYYPNCSNT